MFNSIDRDVLIIFPKQPLIDWVNSIYPKENNKVPALLEHDQGNIYLIPELSNRNEFDDFLKENYLGFFENELFEWHTDEDSWPKELSLEKFQQWFHCSYQSVVVDTMDEQIEVSEW